MSLPTLKAGGKDALDAFLKASVARRHVPAITLGATNAKETVYFNQDGEVVFGDASSGTVDEDTTMEIYSQTKFITSIAAMQCVDKGLVSLDSTEDIKRILPELATLPLLKGYEADGTPILAEVKNKVTLRMLLSHSAGMAYPMNEILFKWLEQNKRPGLFGPDASVESLMLPYIYEPGTSWTYSHSIDWAGFLVERVSGKSLEEYMRDHIFIPCGATTLTFFPNEHILAHKQALCERNAEGNPEPTKTGFGMGRPTDVANTSTKFLSGGGGLFGTQKDCLAILRGVLQCDPKYRSLSTSHLLSEASYAELWKPSVPRGEGFDGCDKICGMVSKPKYFGYEPTPETVNHSVGCLITSEEFPGRRKAGSGCWSGAAKTQWWVDPAAGIAGICGTQLLSSAPDPWFATYVDYEKTLYANLE